MWISRLPSPELDGYTPDLPSVLKGFAGKTLAKIGSVSDPLVLVVRADGTNEAWILWLKSVDYCLPNAAAGLRQFLADREAVAYGVCAETWMVERSRADLAGMPRSIAGEPDRVEAVLITGQADKDRGFELAFRIERDRNGAYTGLGPELLEGRKMLAFSDLLNRPSVQ